MLIYNFGNYNFKDRIPIICFLSSVEMMGRYSEELALHLKEMKAYMYESSEGSFEIRDSNRMSLLGFRIHILSVQYTSKKN
jgi:hypothetical protein